MRVGVLGGGQLGRMLALAGHPLGLSMRFLDPSPYAPVKHLGEFVVGDYQDSRALGEFITDLDVVTYEFENVPAEAVEWIAQRVPVYPPARALRVAQDREQEKKFFAKASLDVHPWRAAHEPGELDAALAAIGVPCVIKTLRGGYDGKGQGVARTLPEARALAEQLGGRAIIVESFVPFSRELSLIAARSRDGSFSAYPLTENIHAGGILRQSTAPAQDVPERIEKAADAHVRALMAELDYVGVLAVEFFEHDGALLANEMAPRVHNSGHWTIEGAATSQFENHLRAICDMPLGATSVRGHAAMVNLIGDWPDARDMLRVPGAHVHLYAKSPRPGRKVGHVTVVGDDRASVLERATRLRAMADDVGSNLR